MGHLLTSNGLKPDPEKVRAVKEMPIPDGATRGEKVKAVQRFLGFVNYNNTIISDRAGRAL